MNLTYPRMSHIAGFGLLSLWCAGCGSNPTQNASTVKGIKQPASLSQTPTRQSTIVKPKFNFSVPVNVISVALSGPTQVPLSKVAQTSFSLHLSNNGQQTLAVSVYATLTNLAAYDSIGRMVYTIASDLADGHLKLKSAKDLVILAPGKSLTTPFYLDDAFRPWRRGQYTLRATVDSPDHLRWEKPIFSMLQKKGTKMWKLASVTAPPFSFMVR